MPVRLGRFSDGTHPVLYTALEWETAGHEYGHWIPTNYGPVRDTAFRVRLHLISCDFAGRVKDIRPFLAEYPWLTANDHVECQRLGAIATAEVLDGLLAPSARRDLGTTVPVLVRGAVSKPRQESDVIFLVDPNAPDGMTVTFSR